MMKQREKKKKNINKEKQKTMCSLSRASTTVRSSGIASFILVDKRAWDSVNHDNSSSRRSLFVRDMDKASARRVERWAAF